MARSWVEPDLPITLDRSIEPSLRVQLATALRIAVRDGLLAPASRLPSSRLLADRLGVARSTVIAAYEQLDGEGFLEVRRGSGTYVSTQPGAVAALTSSPAASIASATVEGIGDVIDLRPGQPDTRRLVDASWRQAWRLAARAEVPAVEPPAQGLAALRDQIAAHLRAARGIDVDPAGVFVTAGTADALTLITHALGRTSGLVAVEDPGYPAARRVLVGLGCRLQGVPVDRDGVLVDRLRALSPPPGMVVVTPSHQYPLGGRLPVGRRLALLDWARSHHAMVVEDDYDSEFRYGVAPLPALASLDPDASVLHLGTFSKVVSPWLRVGYLLAPPRLRPALLRTRLDLGTSIGGVTQQALVHYLASGGLRRHIARVRRDYAHRRHHLARSLTAPPGLSLRGSVAGLHVVVDLPDETDVSKLLAWCYDQGVLLADLREYNAQPGGTTGPAVVVGYGNATLHDLDRAVAALTSGLDHLSRADPATARG